MIPILYFIDPFGWSGIPFDIIHRILSHRYSEIIFVLMTYEIARFVTSPLHQNSLNILYGGDYWKEALTLKGEERHQALVQLYEERLKNETDARFVWSFRVNSPDMRRRTKYYVIHATHHPLGLRVMKRIMRKQGAGIFEYLGPEENMMSRVQRFDFFDLPGYLKKHFTGRTVTFDELCDELYPITRHQVSQYIDSDFRESIKEMEREGDPDIRITRVYSSKTGLNKTDEIHFR